MLIKLKTKKAQASNWLLLTFTIVLIVGAVFSEFFQAPVTSSQELSRFTALFNEVELKEFSSIKITNKLGIFEIKLVDQNWELTYPRHLEANPLTVSNIFDTLGDIKIKKVIAKDDINILNFALDNPVITYEIKKAGDLKPLLLKIGLTNSIDNSTYLTIEDQNTIFQAEAIKHPIESYALGQFINTNLFSNYSENVSELALYRGKLGTNTQFELERVDGIWKKKGKNGSPVETAEVNSFLASIRYLKDQLILDTVTEKQSKAMERYQNAPQYTLVVVENGKKTVFEISGAINQIPDIKIEKWQNVLVTSDQKKHPTIVGKVLLDLLSRKATKPLR